MSDAEYYTTPERTLRKRKRRTSDEQYEAYLSMMEEDYNFRTGIINPTLGDDYLIKKWDELAEKLNSMDSGPQLSGYEWKRRFKDWKNSTRQKCRKIEENKRRCESDGSQIDLKLTTLEERGLSVWGKAPVYGRTDEPQIITLTSTSVKEALLPSTPATEAFPSTGVTKTPIPSPPKKEVPRNTGVTDMFLPNPSVIEKLFLEEVIERDIADQTINLSNFIEMYKNLEEKKIALEELKLKFEIEKYKLENPDFKFSI